ncbi:hypothetical protein MRX96_000606 [Rhipicephalus microplus]
MTVQIGATEKASEMPSLTFGTMDDDGRLDILGAARRTLLFTLEEETVYEIGARARASACEESEAVWVYTCGDT